MNVLWVDPSFGASGDMLLGALIGLGADPQVIRDRLGGLGVTGWTIEVTPALRCGLSATRAHVVVTEHDHHHDHDHDHDGHAHDGHAHTRRWSEIDALIAGADLPDRVRDGSRRTFRRLGEIEAAAHDVPIDEVLFHEVGAVDAIVDIVGTWVALDLLGAGTVVCGPVGLGSGTVLGAHGVLPLPAPATASLLAGAPVRSLAIEMETCTPTGAALLATMGTWGPMPAGVLQVTARGAGGRDPATHPNVVTGHLIDVDAGDAGTGARTVTAVQLETNLDDVTPEVIGHVLDLLLAAGADDAWVAPIVMKKSRPAHELRVLAAPEHAAALREIIARETGTLGVRERSVIKHVQPRRVDTVEIHGAPVRIKVGPHGAKPEHDDLVALAAATGRPLRDLAAEALARHAGR